jgi:Flp pilus assembly protein CpaB
MELTGKRYGRGSPHKLLSTRRGTILVAIGCAAAAALVLVFAMGRYRKSVEATGKPPSVFVATREIFRNTPGSVVAGQDMFNTVSIPSTQVSPGAIVDAAALRGRVAARDIYPGEQLTAADFTANGGMAAQLAPSERAVTLTLDTAHGMIGTIQDGDHVDVYAGMNVNQGTGQNQPELRLLIRDVPVLKAGSQASASTIGGSSANDASQITLGVAGSDAGALTYAADYGKVWLVLRPANATETPPPPIQTVQSFLSAAAPVRAGGK